MKRAQAILAAVLALSLSACVLGRKKPVASAAPVAPQPEPPPPPAPLPQPISIPQTNVQLPAPQPISADALATTIPREEPTSPPTPARTSPRRSGGAGQAAAPKPEAPAPAATLPAAPAGNTPAVSEPEPPRLQEGLAPEESKRLQDAAEGRRQEATQIVEATRGRHLNSVQKNFVSRIRSFVSQSEAAAKRGDMRQAYELASRALVLAKELQP